MKKLVVLLLLSVGALLANTAQGQTAPQEQASNLAVPEAQPMLKTVVTVVQCNTVIGLLAIDDAGNVHPAHFTAKKDVEAIQHAVPADHNMALNVGCPGNVSKDTTVL